MKRAANYCQPSMHEGISTAGSRGAPEFITRRRSVAKRGGCFQRRLFICQFVYQFVCTITSERLNVGRSNLAIRYAVQKSRSSSKFKVKGQRSRSPGTKKDEKLLSRPH